MQAILSWNFCIICAESWGRAVKHQRTRLFNSPVWGSLPLRVQHRGANVSPNKSSHWLEVQTFFRPARRMSLLLDLPACWKIWWPPFTVKFCCSRAPKNSAATMRWIRRMRNYARLRLVLKFLAQFCHYAEHIWHVYFFQSGRGPARAALRSKVLWWWASRLTRGGLAMDAKMPAFKHQVPESMCKYVHLPFQT